MKKLSLLTVAAMMAAGAFAATPSYVKFSSTGPDKYADGTDVLPGEVYALVWVKEGCAFKGISAETGKLVDPENNRFIGAAPLAVVNDKGEARCPTVIFLLDGANAELPAGTFSVYLLDTRVTTSSESVLPDGTKKMTTNTTLAGVGSNFNLAAINGFSMAAENVTASEPETVTADKAIAQSAAVAAALPADKEIPNPVVKGIKVVNGQVLVTIANTVPYLQYGVTSGEDLSYMTKNDLVPGVNGSTDPNGEITIVVDDPNKHRFFRVIRK